MRSAEVINGRVPGLEPLDGGALRVGRGEVASDGGDVRVAKEFLDDPEIGTARQQRGGVAVSQDVGAVVGDPRVLV